MMPNVLDFDIRRGAVVVWPKSLALYLGIVNTPCLSVSDEAEKQSDYALGDNSTLVRLWQIIPCTDFTENSASLQPLQCYKRYVVHKEVVWPKSLALYLGIVKSQFQMQQKSSQIMLSQCVCGKLFRAQISPFATITNYCASLQPLQYVVQYIIAVWFPRIFLPPTTPPPQATSWFLIIRRQGNGPLHRITGWFLEEANFSLLCTCAKTPSKQVNEDDIGDNLLWTLFAL